MVNNKKFAFGNARVDRQPDQWLFGFFRKDKGDLYFDSDVEIKFTDLKAGQEKGAWTKRTYAKTFDILIKGKFLISSDDREFVLEKEGDYIIFGPGVNHTWKAIEDSTVLTVRWPSARDPNVPAKQNYFIA